MVETDTEKKIYKIGVMQTLVESTDETQFGGMVDQAIEIFKEILADELNVGVTTFRFEGPHLTPKGGAYSAMDFLRIGLSEKVERKIDFLLIVTEVDLAASKLSFALALPSQLTNVAVISTKRLDPSFWGEESSVEASPRRLASLMLHSLGHLLNLSHSNEKNNVMFDFQNVAELDLMSEFTQKQHSVVVRNMPIEAREHVTKTDTGRLGFITRAIAINVSGIVTGIVRANPLKLLTRLPTMITAAVSVLIFLLFTPDMWEVASAVDLYQMVLFSGLSIGGAALALYKSFAFGSVLSRDRTLSESAIVTEAVSILTLLLTMTTLLLIFSFVVYISIETIFPEQLIEAWTFNDEKAGFSEIAKLCLFLGGLSVLAGSLGGRADSQDLIRGVLFTDEET